MKFNLVITGVGGQGILTLGQMIAEAAFLQGYEVRTAELHGLSQRGGHTEVHVRFGEKVHSPLVMQADAELIISLELLESLRACYYANEDKTIFLVSNNKIPPISVYLEKTSYPSIADIEKILRKFSKKLEIVDVLEVAEKKKVSKVLSNTYLFGYSISRNYLPIEKEPALRAIEKIIGARKPGLMAINKEIFEEAFRK